MMASAIKGSQWNHEMTEGLSSLKRKVWVELKLEAYIPWAEEAGVGTITVPVGFFFDVLMRLLYNFYSPLVFFVKVYEKKNTKSNPFCRNFCNEPLSFILHDFSQQTIHVNERYLFMSFFNIQWLFTIITCNIFSLMTTIWISFQCSVTITVGSITVFRFTEYHHRV